MDRKTSPGRPKLDWQPFEDELDRRFKAGIAKPTVEAEADALAKWANGVGYKLPNGAPLKKERIRERIKKRLGGSEGYQNTRQYHLDTIERAKRTDLNKSANRDTTI